MKTKAKIENGSWTQFKRFIAGLLLALTLPQSYAAPGDVDFSFDPGSTINGQVNAVALQSNGKAVIVGSFNTLQNVMRGGVARLNTNGTTDETFLHELQGVNDFGYVKYLAMQSDDKVLIGGWFNSVNGVTRTNLARLNADGSLDDSFLVEFGGDSIWVNNLAVQNDGKIIVIGSFTSLNGVLRTNIARLNPDGSVDSTFTADLVTDSAPAEPGCLAVQEDGKILIGGWIESVSGVARTNLARLNVDGTLDATFTACLAIEDVPAVPSFLTLQSDGKIFVGGAFSSVNGVGRTNIARLNVDGSLDNSFVCTNTDPSGDVSRIIPCHDGRIVACGTFSPDGVEPMNVARLNADGSWDTSFRNSVPDGGAISAVIQKDDRIVIVGEFLKVGGVDRRCIARLNSDGSLDNSYENGGGPTGPNSALNSLIVQTDGRILIGGYFSSVSGKTRKGIARLNPDGSLDDSFTPSVGGSYPWLRCTVIQSDGKILLGGDFNVINGGERNGIARLNADGTLDTTFANVSGLGGTDSGVETIALQTNGQILIGGRFQAVNGEPRSSLARLNTDGALDPGFTNNPIGARPVRAILVQHDGKVVVGGGLPMLLSRFNADGTRDNSFWSSATEINCLVEQPDGKILAGGHFTKGNVQWNGIARILSDGTVDETFLNGSIGPEGPVYRLGLEADGKIIVAGDFRFVDGVSRRHIARLNPDGSLDASFVVDLHQWDSPVVAIAVQPDTKILLGGYFTAVNQTPRSYVARLMGSCVPPSIKNAPRNCTAEIGSVASLGVVADGFPALEYQWFFNGTNLLTSCTNRTLQFAGTQLSHAGSYTVVITNAGGSVTSAPAMLNVIAAVERRLVPGVMLTGETGSLLNVEYANFLSPAPGWTALGSVSLTSTSQFYFDLTAPLPPQRFYRAWQMGTPSVVPSLNLNFVPAITLTGNVGDTLQLDYINAIGPTDAWVTLGTVTLTNTSQLYFDVSAPGQPTRLYRIVPVP